MSGATLSLAAPSALSLSLPPPPPLPHDLCIPWNSPPPAPILASPVCPAAALATPVFSVAVWSSSGCNVVAMPATPGLLNFSLSVLCWGLREDPSQRQRSALLRNDSAWLRQEDNHHGMLAIFLSLSSLSSLSLSLRHPSASPRPLHILTHTSIFISANALINRFGSRPISLHVEMVSRRRR